MTFYINVHVSIQNDSQQFLDGCADGSCLEELCRGVEFESASSQDSDGCTPPPPSFSEISHCSGIILI